MEKNADVKDKEQVHEGWEGAWLSLRMRDDDIWVDNCLKTSKNARQGIQVCS